MLKDAIVGFVCILQEVLGLSSYPRLCGRRAGQDIVLPKANSRGGCLLPTGIAAQAQKLIA